MKIHLLKQQQLIPKDLASVFSFFNHPENLEKLTPKSLQFKIITPLPIRMKEGCIIDYSIKIYGFRQRWRSIISHYDPPHQFVDEQLKGPYSFWHHTHRFEQVDNGTMMFDEVRYGLPLGFLGHFAHALFVKRELKKIFAFRKNMVEKIF